jgi:hypothetical protein
MKCQLDATGGSLLQKLIVRSTCFGNHYAHHQELKSIIKMVAACGTWYFGFHVVGLAWSCGLCVRLRDATAPRQTDNLKTKA